MVAVQQKSTCLIIRRFTFPTFRQLWKVINKIPQLGESLCCKKNKKGCQAVLTRINSSKVYVSTFMAHLVFAPAIRPSQVTEQDDHADQSLQVPKIKVYCHHQEAPNN